jgi:hypothetical protein
MADTALEQFMVLHHIHRPRHGWREVYHAIKDKRLLILRQRGADRSPRWVFGVRYNGWADWPNPGILEHQEGPFATRAEAEAAARRWFLDNPAGDVAELLARQPHNPGLRSLLVALNNGDLTAGNALHDQCVESDVPDTLCERVEDQLTYLGIWPVEADAD